MERCVYDGRKIEWDIIRRNRKTLAIQIDNKGRVWALAPQRLPQRVIREAVQERAAWILRKLDAVAERMVPPQRFHDRAMILFAGEEYTLRTADKADWGVEIVDDSLWVIVTEPTEQSVQILLTHWMQRRAEEAAAAHAAALAPVVGAAPTRVAISKARKRWGSCSKQGRIRVNWRLIMAPPAVMAYVVAHELCHLLHLNHSRDFWREVARVVPEYRQHIQWLSDNGPRLFAWDAAVFGVNRAGT